MYKYSYIAVFALIAACGEPPRSTSEITTAVDKPTGAVDATSSAALVVSNIQKNELFEKLVLRSPRLPTGFAFAEGPTGSTGGTVADFFVNACNGVARDGKDNITKLDLTAEGLSGSLTLAVSCTDTHAFSMRVAMSDACSATTCFNGEARYELKDGSLIWSLRATTKAVSGGTTSDVDIGGVAKVGGGIADIKMLGFFKTIGKDGKPTSDPAKSVVLTWGESVGNYSPYNMTGTNGKFRCNTPDSGKSGCCRQLNAQETPTGEEFTWGGFVCK